QRAPGSGITLKSSVTVEDVRYSNFGFFSLTTASGLLPAGTRIRRPADRNGVRLEIAYPVQRCEAIGKPVRYPNISPEERRHGMRAAGLPPFMIDAVHEQTLERLRHPESRVELGTHELFGVKPTTFAEFARRHAAVFAGT